MALLGGRHHKSPLPSSQRRMKRRDGASIPASVWALPPHKHPRRFARLVPLGVALCCTAALDQPSSLEAACRIPVILDLESRLRRNEVGPTFEDESR